VCYIHLFAWLCSICFLFGNNTHEKQNVWTYSLLDCQFVLKPLEVRVVVVLDLHGLLYPIHQEYLSCQPYIALILYCMFQQMTMRTYY